MRGDLVVNLVDVFLLHVSWNRGGDLGCVLRFWCDRDWFKLIRVILLLLLPRVLQLPLPALLHRVIPLTIAVVLPPYTLTHRLLSSSPKRQRHTPLPEFQLPFYTIQLPPSYTVLPAIPPLARKQHRRATWHIDMLLL